MGPTLELNTNKTRSFRSSLKASTRRITNSISPVKQDELYSLAEKALPAFSTDRSSTSSRSSHRTVYKSRAASSSSVSLLYGPDVNGYSPSTARQPASTLTASPIQKHQALDSASPQQSRPLTASHSFPHADFYQSPILATMTTTVAFASESRPGTGKPGTSQSNVSFGQGANSSVPLPPPSLSQTLASGSIHNPHTVFQHIHDTASKRISTLDYLRKA
ncbi:MAG: hypothetical protein Q9218_000205 [Villophora microphyllina]